MHPVAPSFWLETAGDDLTPRPALDGSTTADVAILGAGLTGLWTAWYLARRDPSLRVVVVEREIAGFAASGRNGAWCAPDLNISMGRLARLHGEDAARRMQQATYDAVDEVARAATEAGIDAGFHKGGSLYVARGPQGVPALEDALREYERFGFGDRYRLLDAGALDDRIRIAGATRALAGGRGDWGAAAVASERGPIGAREPRAGALAPIGYPASVQALRIAAVANAGAMPAFPCST